MQAKRRNLERMVEKVPDTDWQVLQNFISHSPWDAQSLTKQMATAANAAIGGDADSCLLLDESGFSKKGQHSVGVSRQYNGRLGKVDHCQVAVFAALCRRKRVTLIDTRLYLPENWTTAKDRCRAAGVPATRQKFQKKAELALEMVQQARENGVVFEWVGGDAFYGDDPTLLRQLDQQGEMFMLDVHQDQRVYLEDPQPYIPKRQGRFGRHPRRYHTDHPAVEVRTWAAEQPQGAWHKIGLRSRTNGDHHAHVLHRLVWLWDGLEAQAHQWHLLVTRTPSSPGKLKYSLSNAPLDTPLPRLVFMQGQRYWIERALEDAKSELGMADYQVRGWTAWHHHMALVLLAQLFCLEIRLKYKTDHPLLSCHDVREVLAFLLPQRQTTVEEVLRQLLFRHQQRADSIKYYLKKQLLNKSD